jgi:hypothetical protein
VDKLNFARALRQIEGDDEDEALAETIASFSLDEDDTGLSTGVGWVPDNQDLTAPPGGGEADQKASNENPVPLLDDGDADPSSDEGDPALSLDAGEADQSSTSENPATTPEAGDTEPNFDGDALGSELPMGMSDPSSGPKAGPFDGGDPNANPKGSAAWLWRHLHMLHRLAAGYHSDGLLLVGFLDVDAETGEESNVTDWLKYEDFRVLKGVGHFEKADVDTPKRMVDAVLELTAARRAAPECASRG